MLLISIIIILILCILIIYDPTIDTVTSDNRITVIMWYNNNKAERRDYIELFHYTRK